MRNFIEIRNHDCVGKGLQYSIPAIYKGIMYNNTALCETEDLLKDFEYKDYCEMRYNVPKSALNTSAGKYFIKDFAKEIVFLCRRMKTSQIEYALINQLLRYGTSVGANIHEAQYAQGTKDFISKLEIALKECNESDYWIELLYETNSISKVEFDDMRSKIIELRRMLVSSVTTLKSKQNQL